MTVRSTAALLALLLLPGTLMAQHGAAAATPLVTTAPAEATQFDFLVGQWELVVRVPATTLAARIHGAPQLAGTWKAWRALDGWGVEDEMRITDRSGNPLSLSTAIRVYDATVRHWSVALVDVYRARITSGTAEWQGGVMQLASRGTDQDGAPTMTRARIWDITPAAFRWQQERSADEGRTWNVTLTIEARRVAATAPR